MPSTIQIIGIGTDSPEDRIYSMMIIKSRWATFDISGGYAGDVEICCEHDQGSDSVFLDQDQLKQLIAFLQTKVKQ